MSKWGDRKNRGFPHGFPLNQPENGYPSKSARSPTSPRTAFEQYFGFWTREKAVVGGLLANLPFGLRSNHPQNGHIENTEPKTLYHGWGKEVHPTGLWGLKTCSRSNSVLGACQAPIGPGQLGHLMDLRFQVPFISLAGIPSLGSGSPFLGRSTPKTLSAERTKRRSCCMLWLSCCHIFHKKKIKKKTCETTCLHNAFCGSSASGQSRTKRPQRNLDWTTTPCMELLWMDNTLHHFETWGPICLLVFKGESSFPGVSGGVGFRPSTVLPQGLFRTPDKHREPGFRLHGFSQTPGKKHRNSSARPPTKISRSLLRDR